VSDVSAGGRPSASAFTEPYFLPIRILRNADLTTPRSLRLTPTLYDGSLCHCKYFSIMSYGWSVTLRLDTRR